MGSVFPAMYPEGTGNVNGSTEAGKAAYGFLLLSFVTELQKSEQ